MVPKKTFEDFNIKDLNVIMKDEDNSDYFALQFKTLIDNIPGGVSLYKLGERINTIYANDVLYKMFGYVKDHNGNYIEDRKVEIINEDYIKLNYEIKEKLKKQRAFECKFRLKNDDGSLAYIMVKGKQVGESNGIPIVIITLIDITKGVNYENDLKFRVKYDKLTGLLNKDDFYAKAYELLLNNPDKQYDIMCINVERFKIINDLYGVEEGDKLLKFIANKIQNHLDSNLEASGRLYADNFALCVLRTDGYEDRTVELIKKYFANYPLDLYITVGFGIYRIIDNDILISKMCDRANMATKSIRGNYKKRYAYYDERHLIKLLEEQEIINDMHDALKGGQFDVYFQPKYYLSNNKIVGAEALVRWIHPVKGIIPPNNFIQVFERSGFITAMDEYVWEFTCKKIREWIDKGYVVVPISVNVSRVDMYNPKLSDNLKGLVQKYNIPIELLELEITETAYTDNPSQLIEAVLSLKEVGFTVEMDDFGSGYSSLNMLNEVPVDVLKLDLRFLKPSKVYGRGANILNSIVSMAKWLNLPVVAEGIESKEQVDFLRSIGCNKGQGYYFAKPMPYQDFEILLKNRVNEDNCNEKELLESFIDIEEFWNPNSQINILFNSFVGGVGILELRGNKFFAVRVNDRFFDILNIDRDAFYNISPHLIDYVLEEDREFLLDKLKEAKKTKEEILVQFRFLNPLTNNILYLQIRIKVILNSEERTMYLSSIENYTEQIESQRKLQNSEQRYEKVMELTQDIVFEWNFKSKSIAHSKNFKQKFGYEPKTENFPESIVEAKYVIEEDADAFYNFFKQIENGKQELSQKFRIRKFDDKYIWCMISATGIYDENNNLNKVVGIINDIDLQQKRLREISGK